MKWILRLIISCFIRHNEIYYINACRSQNIDFENLTHDQISTWIATMKIIEADILIDVAKNLKKSRAVDIPNKNKRSN